MGVTEKQDLCTVFPGGINGTHGIVLHVAGVAVQHKYTDIIHFYQFFRLPRSTVIAVAGHGFHGDIRVVPLQLFSVIEAVPQEEDPVGLYRIYRPAHGADAAVRIREYKNFHGNTSQDNFHRYYSRKRLPFQTFSVMIKRKEGEQVGGIVEIDLHGKNTYQARVTIDAVLRRAGNGTYRLRLIHGYHGGTAIRDMIREEYPRRGLRIVTVNEGTTDLVLREF